MSNHTYNDALFAQFYDIIIERMGTQNLEIDFWKSCAKVYGDPILELGCGTGRLLLALAEMGYFVMGIDISPHMLRILEQKLSEASSDVRNKVQWKLGDMIDPVVNRHDFRLIIFAASQFLHLKNDDQRLTCLKNSRLLLADSGVLIISSSRLNKGRQQSFRNISKPEDPFILQTRETWEGNVFLRYFKLIQGQQEHLFWWSLYPIEDSHIKQLIKKACLRCIPPPSHIPLPKERNIYLCMKNTAKIEIRGK